MSGLGGDAELRAAIKFLSALQSLVRLMKNLAYLDDKATEAAADTIARYQEATVRWNSAIYAVLLVGSPAGTDLVIRLDREVDRLADRARSRSWSRDEFREVRKELGRIVARYLVTTRKSSGFDSIALRSVWAWDDPTAATETGAANEGTPLIVDHIQAVARPSKADQR